jgi:hypothetical protein
MQVYFTVTPQARADLVRLLEPRVAEPLDAVLRAGNILDDVEQQVLKYSGVPPDVLVRGIDGRYQWWRYVDGIWLGFDITDGRRGALRRPTRTVTLAAAASRPPRA